ncbi:unnamed protein product, partial [Urochloa humidicola]
SPLAFAFSARVLRRRSGRSRRRTLHPVTCAPASSCSRYLVLTSPTISRVVPCTRPSISSAEAPKPPCRTTSRRHGGVQPHLRRWTHPLPRSPRRPRLHLPRPYALSRGKAYRGCAAEFPNLTVAAWLEATNRLPAEDKPPASRPINATVNCSCGDTRVSPRYGRLFLTYPLDLRRENASADGLAQEVQL